jgi:hypothetical protein
VPGQPGQPGQHVPSVSSRQLGRELRALREGKGIGCAAAAAALDRDPMWLVQIEVGQERITVEDLLRLLEAYAVTEDAVRGDLVELATRSGGPSWLRPHVPWLKDLERDFIVLESEASTVRAFGIMLIPELMRTEAYARTIYAAVRAPDAGVTVEQELDLLLNRQRHRVAGSGRRLHVILDEQAVRRPIGDRGVMAGQLRHLVERGRQDDAVVQLIPREVGAHVGLDGAFHILDFGTPDEPSVSVSHSALGPLLSRVDLDGHFTLLERTALGPADSLFMIEQVLDEL